MKTLKELFGKKETKKSINSFLNQLDLISMMKIKGGDEEDDVVWPHGNGGQ